MISRRMALTGGLRQCCRHAASRAATPGVTATEIKIGNTMPYSGPASAYSSVGKADVGFFKWVNDQGGVAGRKINFLSYDDGYSPPKTVEQVRRLVEEDKVDFLFHTLGTPTNSAIERYCNQHKVPQLFVATGADKWGNYKEYPWTIGWQPSYRTEAQIYTKYMLKEKPNAKLGILYQNDDFGKDYPVGVKDVLGKDWDKYVAKSITYEVTDATVDFQILRAAIVRGRCAAGGRDAEIRRSGDPQGSRPELEAAVLHDQRGDLGRRGDATGRAGEFGRHAEHAVPEGFGRPGLGQRSGDEGVQGVHGEIRAGRRHHRQRLHRRLRGELLDVEGAGAVQRRFLA